MLPLFVITMLLTIPMLSVTNNCDTIGQTELYYENAENLDSWTEYYNLPAGEFVYAYQTYPIDYVCKNGSCFWLSDDNYYDSGTFAELVSDPITTIGYSNITLIFYVYLETSCNCTPNCSTFYSIGSGFTLKNTFSLRDNKTFIVQSLGSGADNINNLKIKFRNDGIDNDYLYCYYDEIRICGNEITHKPTTNPSASTLSPSTDNPTKRPSSSASPSEIPSRSSSSPTDHPSTFFVHRHSIHFIRQHIMEIQYPLQQIDQTKGKTA
eukprot:258939_1